MRVPATRAARLALSRPAILIPPSSFARCYTSKAEKLADAVDSVLTADLSKPSKTSSSSPRRSPKSDALFAGERVSTTSKPVLAPNPLAKKFGLSKEEFRSSLSDFKEVRTRKPREGERVLLEGPEETITVGPGYLFYGGPTPQADLQYGAAPPGAGIALSYARLRDACPCPKCIHPSTRQKTHTSGEAFREVSGWGTKVADVTEMHMAKEGEEHGVAVHWPETLEGEAHSSFYPVSLLRRLASRHVRGAPYYLHGVKRQLWDRELLLHQAPNLWTDYKDLQEGPIDGPLKPNKEVFLRVLEQLQKYGLAVLKGVPTSKTGNKDNSIREFAEAIGPLRNTFYGETWNVQSVADSKNVAYTSLNLGLHMDLCYYQLPPRFQFLHCLRNRVIGGASYFVDSFKAAEYLQSVDPLSYDLLSRNKIVYEYDNDGHYMTYAHRVLPVSVHSSAMSNAIFWSPPFQAPPVKPTSPLVPYSPGSGFGLKGDRGERGGEKGLVGLELENAYYGALSAFQAALDRPEFRYEFTMAEGDAVLFDNNRVLHARTAFRDRTDEELKRDKVEITPGEPTRWLKGLYLDGSTVWDRMMVLNDQVRGQ